MFEFTMTPEQIALRDETREFAKSVSREYILDMDADKIKYPKEYLKECGKQNLIGLRVPKEYGGRGLGWEEDIIALEELCVNGYMFGCTYGVTGDVVTEAIVHFGTEEQKKKFLIPICKGEKFAAECLTEPRGGSDFFGTTTIATKDGDDYILNGQKRFIVGGEGADYFLVYARTNTEVPPHKGITCFMVEREMGVKTDYLYGLMGCRGGGTARVVFDNVRVPKENVIGKVDGATPIFYQMMVPERFGTAAMTIGAVRPALEIATDYSTKRKAFGRTINKFQGVNFKIADAVTKLDTCRSMMYITAKAVDSGADPNLCRRLVSEGKKFVTEQCWDVANLSMQVMGGIGYTDVYPIEKILRDMRLSMIWVGSNEIMNVIVQHEWYEERKKELANNTKRNSELDALNAFDEEEKIYE
ncbi:Acyl-CoA dehydrogenase/oxidase C-terminal [Syntrophomonas zehnderi OL-4]|uniref:Acyl-CoA dehydrogenase/oxidase C-terminal n=1 Tax=Syntrophomonas zehnderi OL-4 TaxID=690567 RepID=A0A0E3W361_9FIRM|nr:acyl-CoA dehydrogenase family protein [Syntrophomonas zehnderi]CFX52625.1 Acyl-CoA dehydrogenase/oxidase C-terminal [Syntrophomonas zehnderi OL-4]